MSTEFLTVDVSDRLEALITRALQLWAAHQKQQAEWLALSRQRYELQVANHELDLQKERRLAARSQEGSAPRRP